MIRVGKRNWIIGQVITILVSSFIYTLWNCACSLLIISPCVAYEAEWGQALYTIASSPEVFRLAGANQAFAPYAAIMELISPKLAMATAIAVFWLCAAMCGMIILCFHIHFGKMSGISICGALTSFAYFSCYLGRLSYGEWMYCISPVNWSCISYLDWFDIGTSQKPQGAVLIYVIVIVCLAAAGCCGFCKKDIMLTDGGM
ncbi:MAG: hypothetical protein IJ468_01170 [Lachnospiraceae bacterium]|nr:hypothetical protein [Lachnospiraceae bacterium]